MKRYLKIKKIRHQYTVDTVQYWKTIIVRKKDLLLAVIGMGREEAMNQLSLPKVLFQFIHKLIT